MGVTDLWTILAPVKKHRTIASLKGQTIAVDLSMWVCESVTVKPMQGKVVKPHLRNLFFRVSNLLQYGIKLVFVLDGEAPELKWDEMARRQQVRYGGGSKATTYGKKTGRRSNLKVLLKECQEMLSLLGIPCVQSKGEAEAMCALLNNQKVVDGCLTEDGDAFLYGALTVYRNFTLDTKDPHVDSYSMADIKEILGYDRNTLIALALLLGCDYVPKGVMGVGQKHGCQLMDQLRGEDVLQRFDRWAQGTMATDSSLAKPSHCRVCNHDGTGKQHKSEGCSMCKTHKACIKQSQKDAKCDCTWHIAQCEMDIMRKAMKTPGFPFKPVIQEFLSSREKCPLSPLCWKRPQLKPLQKFNKLNLEWLEDYTLKKVFPLMSLWDLSIIIKGGVRSNDSLVLECLVKTRTRQGVACIEVKWLRPDWDGADEATRYYNTIECIELFAAAYPDRYNAFMEEKARKTRKGTGTKAGSSASPSTSMTSGTGAMAGFAGSSTPLKLSREGEASLEKVQLKPKKHSSKLSQSRTPSRTVQKAKNDDKPTNLKRRVSQKHGKHQQPKMKKAKRKLFIKKRVIGSDSEEDEASLLRPVEEREKESYISISSSGSSSEHDDEDVARTSDMDKPAGCSGSGEQGKKARQKGGVLILDTTS